MILELATETGLVGFVELDDLRGLQTVLRLTKPHIFTNIFMYLFQKNLVIQKTRDV